MENNKDSSNKNDINQQIYDKIKKVTINNSFYEKICDTKLKELIGISIDELVSINGILGINLDEAYDKTILKINSYLSQENNEIDDICATHTTTSIINCCMKTTSIENEITKSKNQHTFKVSDELMNAMDEPNRKATQIMNNEGMDASIKHMTKGLSDGTMDYSTMRSLYG